jgi:CBS domain-containing protein
MKDLLTTSRVVTASVPVGSSKRTALKIMNEQKLAELPVVNEAGQFVGIVDQDKLTSSILLDLVAQE